MTEPSSLAEPTSRVTTLELFFDLVFVFTITQLTSVLAVAPSARSLLEVVLMLGVIWWMYGGYAWMTNSVAPDTTRLRLLLLGGMGGFFILALAIPHAFSETGTAFGIAYLVVVGVHTTFFMRASAASVVRAIVRLAPYNVGAGIVVLAGGILGGTTQYVLWSAAVVFEWLTPVFRGNSDFAIAPAHFVERHGLVLLVAIGESVVAVGLGSSHLAVEPGLVVVALLGLALSAGLWWLYFGGGGDERAEAALSALPVARRASSALRGFGWWHLPMLLGIVTIAATEREALADPFAALGTARAALLGAGVGLYLAGDVLFRHELRIGSGWPRAAAAVASVATIPLGTGFSGAVQIASLVVLLVLVVVVEHRSVAGAARVGLP